MFIRNIVVTILLVLLAACSLISTNRNMQARHEKEIKKLQDKIHEKDEQIEQLNSSVATLREELRTADQANKQLQQDFRLAEQEYNEAVEASQKLRSDFTSLKKDYSDAMAEIDAKEKQLSKVLSEQKQAQEKARHLTREKDKQIAQLNKSTASLKKELKIADSAKKQLQKDYMTLSASSKRLSKIMESMKKSQDKERRVLDAIEELKQVLPEGSMAYDMPEDMIRGDKKYVTLEISTKKAVDDLKRALSEKENIPFEEIKAEVVKITNRMFATLDASPGLSIRTLEDPEVVDVYDAERNIWSWEVEALETGEQKLLLKVGIVLEYDDKEKTSIVFKEPRTFLVKVSKARITSNFLRKNWQFIIQILVIPLAILIWEQIKKYKLKKKPD